MRVVFSADTIVQRGGGVIADRFTGAPKTFR
jgi:hypothetical protein